MHRVTEIQNIDLFDVIRLYLRPEIVSTAVLCSTYSNTARTAVCLSVCLAGLLQLFWCPVPTPRYTEISFVFVIFLSAG